MAKKAVILLSGLVAAGGIALAGVAPSTEWRSQLKVLATFGGLGLFVLSILVGAIVSAMMDRKK
jgi:hypothetical protein